MSWACFWTVDRGIGLDAEISTHIGSSGSEVMWQVIPQRVTRRRAIHTGQKIRHLPLVQEEGLIMLLAVDRPNSPMPDTLEET